MFNNAKLFQLKLNFLERQSVSEQKILKAIYTPLSAGKMPVFLLMLQVVLFFFFLVYFIQNGPVQKAH